MARKLGQHFLTSRPILARIAEAACGDHTLRVIEIGPGRGALTRKLLERTDELHAIEIDSGLIPFLAREFAGHPAFHLCQADVLETDLSQWGPAVVAGNLPYYITSPIVGRFLRLDSRFPLAVFLVQQEVAHRICASPGSRDYGYLSVHTQLLCKAEIVANVPAGAFSPPPKVNSAVIRLKRHGVIDPRAEQVIQFASWCFAHKRKNLRNNLKPYYPSGLLDQLPEANLRAEQLTLAQFSELERRLSRAATVEC